MNLVSERNPRIDVLRGTAILMVMLLHFSLTYRLWHTGPLHSLFGGFAVWSVIGWANFGVTMFFAISGFLITSNALQRYGTLHAIPLRTFYVKRFARLQPLLLVALAIIVTLGMIGVPPFRQPGTPAAKLLLGAWSVLTFWQNILMQKLGYFNYCLNIYWSLSVEDIFYLLFPLACVALRKTWLIAALCIALILIAPWYRAHHMHNEIFYLYANLACFDAIAFGCLGALLGRHFIIRNPYSLILRVAATIMLIAVWLDGFAGERKIYSFSLIALATTAIMVASPSSVPPPWSESRPARAIRWLGRHSYELYLFHIIILAFMREIIPFNAMPAWLQLPWLSGFLILSCVAAKLAANHIGNPANRALRQRFEARRVAPRPYQSRSTP